MEKIEFKGAYLEFSTTTATACGLLQILEQNSNLTDSLQNYNA